MTGTARQQLLEHFGLDAFRPQQEEIIRQVVAGKSALIIMATGEGKSLCYQLPALMLDGVALIVSPLIALMDDQVQALRQRGLPATCIHSMLDRSQREQRLQAVMAGQVKLLYLTPERFRRPGFLEQIQQLQISLMAIDEAHCVSQWGHDFRPDYSRLGEVRHALGSPACVALTATATLEVQQDIRRVLDLGDVPLYHTGIERPNLFLAVREVHSKEEKLERTLQVLEQVGGPGIVYTALIRDLHELEDEVRRRGYKPIIYHGKLSAHERREHQLQFIDSHDDLILATNAFGMGVDKPDIRFILHYQIPRTLENYYQEIGRAGRDGIGSYCELTYLEEDVSIQRNFTDWANPDQAFMQQVVQYLEGLGERLNHIDADDLRQTFLLKNRHDGRPATCLRLLETAGCTVGELGRDLQWRRSPTPEEIAQWLPEGKRQRDLMGLLEMVKYARATSCRKEVIHRYFGFTDLAVPCGACEPCVEADAWLETALPRPRRRVIPKQQGKRQEAPGKEGIRRGDWIQVKGHGLCAVKRVHRHGKRVQVDVERARDLSERSFSLDRVRWRKVDE